MATLKRPKDEFLDRGRFASDFKLVEQASIVTSTSPLMVAFWLPPWQATTSTSDGKIDRSKRQSNKQEGRQGPSTTPFAVSKTNRESPLGPPQRTPATAPVQDTKATATPLHPAQREGNRGRDKRRSDRTAIPPPSTATTPQSDRAYRRNATRRETQTATDRTRSDSKRTPKRPDRRRQRAAQTHPQDHGRSAPTRAGTRAKQATRRAPGSTRPTTGGTPDAGPETTNAQKTATETATGRPTPAPEQTTRGAQQAQENRGTGTHGMRRQAAPTPPSPTSTKNTGKAEKTRKQGQNRW